MSDTLGSLLLKFEKKLSVKSGRKRKTSYLTLFQRGNCFSNFNS